MGLARQFRLFQNSPWAYSGVGRVLGPSPGVVNSNSLLMASGIFLAISDVSEIGQYVPQYPMYVSQNTQLFLGVLLAIVGAQRAGSGTLEQVVGASNTPQFLRSQTPAFPAFQPQAPPPVAGPPASF